MKADPTHQVTLLEVAELDSRALQLRHQRAHLPELGEIAALTAERTALTDQVRDARIVVDDLTVEQAKADREVEQVRTRRERDRNRMDTGQITNPKDLERMQHELVSLEHLPADVDVDVQGDRVSAGGALTYGALAPQLQDRALHNLASLPHISLAGAVATATHGSGIHNKNLATEVRAIEFITADGRTVTLSRDKDGDRFRLAAVHLGAAGVGAAYELTGDDGHRAATVRHLQRGHAAPGQHAGGAARGGGQERHDLGRGRRRRDPAAGQRTEPVEPTLSEGADAHPVVAAGALDQLHERLDRPA